RHAFKITALFLGAAWAVVAFAQDAAQTQQSTGPVTLVSIETRTPSTYLADGEGYALYVLVKSEGAAGGRVIAPKDESVNDAKSDAKRMTALPCKADCREAWPPLTVESADAAIETGDT